MRQVPGAVLRSRSANGFGEYLFDGCFCQLPVQMALKLAIDLLQGRLDSARDVAGRVRR